MIDAQQTPSLVGRLSLKIKMQPRRGGRRAEVLRGKRRAHNGLDAFFGAAGHGQRAAHLGTEQRQDMTHRCNQHLFFRAKIVVRQRARHSRAPRDLADRHIKRSGLTNLGNRSFDERVAPDRLHSEFGHSKSSIHPIREKRYALFIDSSIKNRQVAGHRKTKPTGRQP